MRKELEKKGKAFLVKVLRLFLKNKPLQGEIDLSSVNQILVIRQDNRIGNLILTTPLLLALKKNFPGAKISFLASEASAQLFSSSKLMDELLVLEKKRYIRNPFAFVQNMIKLRRKKFDLAFDCSDQSELSFGHGMWVYLCGAKYRVGHKRDKSSLFLNIEVPQTEQIRHATDMHLDLLRALIPLNSTELPFLEVDKKEEKNIHFYLEKMDIKKDDFLVGINLGGTGRKRWAVENFYNLGDELKRNRNLKIVYIWGPKEKDLIKGLKTAGVLKEILPLPKLSALLKRCDLFISSDSGIMHLSTAVRTPTLAIFFHSDHQKYGPKGKQDRIVYSPEGLVEIREVLEEAENMVEILRNKKNV